MIKYLRTEDEVWNSIRRGEYVKYARLVPSERYKSGVYEVVSIGALRDALKNFDTTIFFAEVQNDGTN